MMKSVSNSDDYFKVQFPVSVIWILYYLAVLVNHGNGTIQWMVKTKPIVFGKSVTLECIISDCCTGHTRRWKSHENQLISQDDLTTDSSKYKSQLTTEGSTLTIFKFDINDANKNYTCVYGFDGSTKKLELNEYAYEWHPTYETMKISPDVISDGHFLTEIQFRQVYPIPNCTYKNNDDILTSEQRVQQSVVDTYFRSVNMTLLLTPNASLCGDISISCTMTTEVVNHVISVFNCTNKDNNQGPMKRTMSPESPDTAVGVVYIIVPCVLLTLIAVMAVILAILWKTRKLNSCLKSISGAKKNQEIEMDEAHKLNPESNNEINGKQHCNVEESPNKDAPLL